MCIPVCITATVCVPLHPKRCLSHSADARSPAWEGRCVFSDVHHFKQSMRIVLVTKVMFSLLIRKWELDAGISFHRCLRSVHNQLPHQTQSGTRIRWNLSFFHHSCSKQGQVRWAKSGPYGSAGGPRVEPFTDWWVNLSTNSSRISFAISSLC